MAGSALRRVWRAPAGGSGTRRLATISVPPATVAAANAGPVPTWLATAPRTGPSRAPPTAAANAVPSAAPRRSVVAAAASHASPPAHVHAPATPWTNRAESSSAMRVRVAEDEARHAHGRQTDQHGRAHAQPAGEHAAGDCAQERADRVGRHQDAGLGLGEAEGVDVVREKRRECGEEHGVDEHHRAHEHDQPGRHPRSPGGYGPDVSSAQYGRDGCRRGSGLG